MPFTPVDPMTFSNPAGRARADADQYVGGLLSLLGARDPLAILDELLPFVRDVLARTDPGVLRRPEPPGKWSILGVVEHLADTELVYGYRVRMVLAQPGLPIQGYDQDRWASTLGYGEGDPTLAVEQLDVLRRVNLRLLRSLDADALARAGVHDERGTESVAQMVSLVAAHDLVHRRQIERIEAAHGV